MLTEPSPPGGDYGFVAVKYFVGSPGLVIQVFKNSWHFPARATPVPVVVGFDNRPVYDVVGLGYPADHEGLVELHVEPAHSVEFMELFSNANTMWVRFKQGNDLPWTTKMFGNRGAASMFARCVVQFAPSGRPTEPYNAAPTQPYGAPATQPYQSEPPRMNAPPPPKPAAVPQVDNGQI
jgi:hypothetical protein